MTTIIYCASWEKGEVKFDEIAKKLQDEEKSFSIVKRKRGSTIITADGDRYQVVYAYDGARGHKWHTCYVDEEISLRIFNTIIKPNEAPICFWLENQNPERRVYYY